MTLPSPMSTSVPGLTTIDSPWRSARGERPGTITTDPLVDRRSVTTTEVPSWRTSRWVDDTSPSGDRTRTSRGGAPVGTRGAVGE